MITTIQTNATVSNGGRLISTSSVDQPIVENFDTVVAASGSVSIDIQDDDAETIQAVLLKTDRPLTVQCHSGTTDGPEFKLVEHLTLLGETTKLITGTGPLLAILFSNADSDNAANVSGIIIRNQPVEEG